MQFAITGKPVTHSLSPLLFREAYGGRYGYDLLIADSAEEAIRLFKEQGLSGMNVTAPFKTDILNFIDKQSEEVAAIGATNTVVLQVDGLLKAYNTDYFGVVNSLKELSVSLAGKPCLVLGAGGAGRAVAYALKEKMGAEVHVVNRTVEKALSLAERMAIYAHGFDEVERLISSSCLIVNTLEPSIVSGFVPLLSKNQVVFDASYKNTLFTDLAYERGCKCLDGRHWLFHQAIPAYKLFTGETPNEKAMRSVLNLTEEDE